MELLLIIGGCILTILTTFVGERVLKFIKQKIRNENVRNILVSIKNIVLDHVKARQQCCVDELKKSQKFTEEEQEKVLKQTKESIINSLSEKIKNYIKNTYGDIDEFITCQIEATIYDLKNSK